MPRRNTLVTTTLLLGIAAESCQTFMGSVDVSSAPHEAAPALGMPEPAAAPIQALNPTPAPSPAPPVAEAAGQTPTSVAGPPTAPAPVPQPDAGVAPSSDAGSVSEPDAGPPPFVPRPIVVAPASALDRVGVLGGGPRLGSCVGSIAIGVRPTANPNTGTFGERLTFIEPICARLSSAASGTLTPERNDALVSWDTSGSFLGTPPTEVPDERVTWVVQPATLCPDAAPVLVGLSGTYDPVAPDDMSTDAIRSLSIECAPLALGANGVDVTAAPAGHEVISQADSFATTGTDTYRSACGAGTVVSQIRIDSGFWLDGFVLGCSALRFGD